MQRPFDGSPVNNLDRIAQGVFSLVYGLLLDCGGDCLDSRFHLALVRLVPFTSDLALSISFQC